jgi:ketosteroid isomerase-like protein
MTTRDAMTTVKALYAAFAAKDPEAIRAVLHDDILWIQCPGFPNGGVRKGPDEVLEKVLGGIAADWSPFSSEIDDFLDAGDTVVVMGRYKGGSRKTGKPMVADFAHVYEVDGGKVRRFRQVCDTQPMVDALAE